MELERFLPKSLLESNLINKHDLNKLMKQNIRWFSEKVNLLNEKINIQLEYLGCMRELVQFSGRIFFVHLLVTFVLN